MAINSPLSSNFAAFNHFQANMTIFGGEAYEDWSIQMRDLFISKGLWDLVQNGYEEPTNEAELASWDEEKIEQFEENQSKDAMALQYIRQGVNNKIFPMIEASSTSKIAWEILMNEFKGSDKSDLFPNRLEHRNLMSAAQDKDGDWLKNIQKELAQLTSIRSTWNISKIPSKLRNLNNDSYSPQIISIGPLHHGMENVLSMEEYKSYYMLSLLEQTHNAVQVFEECGKAILLLDENVRACYAQEIKYNKHDLARMLLFDGCFILELFLRISESDAAANQDPIFTTSWMISTLRRDLSLLENQIPFFILKKLYKIIVRRERTDTSLLKLALHFFKPDLVINEGTLMSSGHHLLDILHKSYLPSSRRVDSEGQAGAWKLMRCATNLGEAGIGFRQDSTKNPFDLKFESGVFKIPPLVVNDSTESLFRNLIAFEQFFPSHGQHVTSYALLMDRLVDTIGDAELLGKKQIIENDLGGYEDVSNLFNNICKEIAVREFYFAELCKQVDIYYNKSWNRYKAIFKRNYLTNPWTIISIFAASLLLSLTILQSVYSVLSYYPH